MIGIIFKGIGLGLVLATLLGPVFFALIHTSLKEGVNKAIFMAIGICLSDAIYIFLTYFGIAQFSENPNFINGMGFGGGIILVISGLVAFFKRPVDKEESVDVELTNKDRLRFFFKGFYLNFINPAVFIFWVGAVGVVSSDYEYKNSKIAIFFLCTVVTIFLTDLIKIYIANKLSKILHDGVMYWISRIAGLLMIGYGIKLIIEKLFIFDQFL